MSSLRLQFLLLTVAGWMTRNQNCVTEYLVAENAVLCEQLRGRRIRYTDAQRRKLAIAAKKLGRKELSMLDTLVTPRTLLGWYRKLVAKKYDGTARRGPGGRRKTSGRCQAGVAHGPGKQWLGLHAHSRRAVQHRP